MTKALLLLTGGRGVPDMLVIKYLRPDIVLNLTTKQGLKVAKNLQKIADEELGVKVEILPPVSPFDKEEIETTCVTAFDKAPNADWTVAHTSAPKMLSIFAIEVAHQRGIPCWFLNTNDSEVISVVKDVPIDYDQLFDATVDEYMKVYERKHETESKEYRKKAEDWYGVARTLASMPDLTATLLKALRTAQKNKPIEDDILVVLENEVLPLVELLNEQQILTIIKRDDELKCVIKGGDSRKFLLGDWLEVYVWKEVEKAHFTNDNQWGHKIFNGEAKSELDVVFTYKALLSVVECKTDDDPFTDKRKLYLDTLDSAASSLGTSYVSKFFIVSHPNPEKIASYNSFKEQADQRRIYIIGGKKLHNVGEILKEQAIEPFFARM